MMKIVTAQEMREIDEKTIRSGLPRLTLMENAGKAVVERLRDIYGKGLYQKRVLIIAGRGNNAGDGFVVARILSQRGVSVSVCLAESPEKFQSETKKNFQRVCDLRGAASKVLMYPYSSLHFRRELPKYSLIIDALFGTGLHSNLKAPYATMINDINRWTFNKAVVAIDIPSGIHGDTGEVMGEAIKADHTVTFGLPKMGLVVLPGIDYVGKLHIKNIGFSKKYLGAAKSDIYTIELDDFRSKLPRRSITTHKGIAGHVLVVAGSPGKTGAASMTARAAFRTGCGLVTLLTHEASIKRVAAQIQEAFLEPFPEDKETLQRHLVRKNAVAIGPGLGFSVKAKELVLWGLSLSKKPMVIDADGLTILADHLSWLRKAKAPVVLTPHPGEMARLVHKTISDVQKNRLYIAHQFAKKYKVTVVLKGARTIVATPRGKVYVNLTGNPALASAGTGDVLTGMMASFIGQKMRVEDAVKAAVYLHGKLGEIWSQKAHASRGLLASDLIRLIPQAIEKSIQENF